MAMPTLIFLLFGVAFLCNAKDYCRGECGKRHTMCKFPTSTPGNKCIDYREVQMRLQQKLTILDAHNKYRSKLALGKQENQPNASDMMELTWDEELAMIAQRWADQCTNSHDSCRHVDRFLVGQNIAFYVSPTYFDIDKIDEQLQGACDSWFSEVKDVNQNTIENFETIQPDKPIGHYTQMVWSRTYKLGCGRAVYKKNNLITVCNYGGAGNIVGEPVYKIGTACIGCPGKIKCRAKQGLCLSGLYPGTTDVAAHVRPYSCVMVLLCVYTCFINCKPYMYFGLQLTCSNELSHVCF